MKNFYKYTFWVFVAALLGLISWSFYKKDISLIKDIGLPLGAILFTVGSLWHTKEGQEFEEKKHLLERRDKYWDKRLNYYYDLKKLVGNINFELGDKDVLPPMDVAFKDSELGKLYISLMKLEDEGEILFNNTKISLLIRKMRERIKFVGTMASNKISAEQVGVPQDERVLKSNLEKNTELILEIEVISADCRKEIFSYLKLE